VRGQRLIETQTPHPSSLGYRLRSDTFSRKGRREESTPLEPAAYRLFNWRSSRSLSRSASSTWRRSLMSTKVMTTPSILSSTVR
jgi:hypothetical protein